MSVSLIIRFMIIGHMFSFMKSKPPVDVKNMLKQLVPMIWLRKHTFYRTNRLYTHLAILINLFVNYGHLTHGFTQSVMIPLVKNKSGLTGTGRQYLRIL